MVTEAEMLRQTAIATLQAHALLGGRCRTCGTAGVCGYAALAANNLDVVGDPVGWLVALSRRCRSDDAEIAQEVLAGLRSLGPPP
jgi:hypothetical protein